MRQFSCFIKAVPRLGAYFANDAGMRPLAALKKIAYAFLKIYKTLVKVLG
jgi:hypothetical protein